MGRAYTLKVLPLPTKANPQPKPLRTWTSIPNGINGIFDPGALEIQFDITTEFAAASKGASTITVSGVALEDLQQARNFQGLSLTLEGGMSGGLPLETPSQYGTLITGFILQSFGNWSGVDQNLSFVVSPASYNYATKLGNFTFYWTKGQKLSDAITSTLKTAFPDLTVKINLANIYVQTNKLSGGHYRSLDEFSQFILRATKSKTNPGVYIGKPLNNNVIVTDFGGISDKNVNIAFNDLIGQPTWNQYPSMQFATVLRGDLIPSATITMPTGFPNGPGASITTPNEKNFLLKYKTTFQGKFQIQSLRHVGNSRDPSGNSWITVIECFSRDGMLAK